MSGRRPKDPPRRPRDTNLIRALKDDIAAVHAATIPGSEDPLAFYIEQILLRAFAAARLGQNQRARLLRTLAASALDLLDVVAFEECFGDGPFEGLLVVLWALDEPRLADTFAVYTGQSRASLRKTITDLLGEDPFTA